MGRLFCKWLTPSYYKWNSVSFKIGLMFENVTLVSVGGKGLKSLGITGSKQLVWASMKDYKDSKICIFFLE